jgi:cob(I)alamin adenosyltransferase
MIPRKKDGLVQVYTGSGKGKTTAALGLIFRALGHGFNVCMIQFLKGGTYFGEYESAKRFRKFKLMQFGVDCPWTEDMKSGNLDCGSCRYCFDLLKDDEKRSKDAMEAAKEALGSGKYDLVVLDEINFVMNRKLIDVNDVISMLRKKSKGTEVVLTGRNAPEELKDFADLVTEMKLIKHPMMKGINGRVGIEF